MKAVARRAESLFSIFLGGGVEHEFFVLETEWLNLPGSIRSFLEPYKWMGYIQIIDEEEVPGTIIFEYKRKYSRGLTADDAIVLYYCIVNEMRLLSADPFLAGIASQMNVQVLQDSDLERQGEHVVVGRPEDFWLNEFENLPPWLDDLGRGDLT
ncbi:hypothetical protein [Dawidia soli]|uniref:Uncharacterized protein n=1 Tax=Dawidia soli TaxID=2782352 RepID=A0AAP2GGJ1_9BACT|nr:hypothetical protein [Dawidia soli]MBT1686181.1 hypothetical protein [Dawidia soli]